MSWKEFDDNCDGCKPAVVDPDTFKLNEQATAVARKVFETCTREQRAAFHRFCCQNERDPVTASLAKELTQKIQKAFDESSL